MSPFQALADDYEKAKYLMENKLTTTYLFLRNYESYNSDSWGFIISVLNTKYDEIINSNETDEIKSKKTSILEIEILCKLFELSESLASLLYAFNSDDSKISENFIDFNARVDGQPHITSNHVYSNLIDTFDFYKIMTFPDVSQLNLTTEEKKFLERYFEHNISIIKKFISIITGFREKNLSLYNKYRHSRPIFIGMPIDYKDLKGISVAMIRKNDTIDNKSLFHSKLSVEFYVKLSMTIIGLQKDIIFNRIHCYECDGYKTPALKSYFPLTVTATKIMEGINNKTGKDIVRKQITAKIEFSLDPKYMDNFIKECQENQTSVFFGEDEVLEKLATYLINP